MKRTVPIFWGLCAWCWLIYVLMNWDFLASPWVKVSAAIAAVLAVIATLQSFEWALDKYQLHGPRLWSYCKSLRGRYPLISTLIVALVAAAAWWFLIPRTKAKR